jgi:hypothetical protein
MEPRGEAADFSDPDWGLGVEGVVALPGMNGLLAADVGLEAVQFASESLTLRPGPFEFARTLSTSQDYIRFYLGCQLGPHGHGFLQPYLAIHGAVVNHSLSNTLSEDFDDPSQNRSQTFTDSDTGVGYDATLGAYCNIRNRFGLYGGAKYLASFGLEEPLGEEERTVDPEYVQVFAGLAIDLGFIARETRER